MTRVAARIGLVILGVAGGLAAAEVVVRIFALAPEIAFIDTGRFRLSDDPRIGYEPIPGFRYRGGTRSYRGRANSLGFRDRDHDVLKQPGVLRIAVLGDSIAEGLTIDRDEDTFPAVLEQILAEEGVPSEVLNFGVNGYNTMQEVALFKSRVLEFEPDLVLVAYCMNDVERSDGGLLEDLLAIEQGRADPSTARWSRRLATSALFRFVRYRVLAHASGTRPRGEADEPLSENTVLASLEELAMLAGEHDFEVLVAVFPYFFDLDRYDSRYAALHDYLRRYCAAIAVSHLDLLEPFRACRAHSSEPVAHDTLHPSVSGHRCAAEAMARRVVQLRRDGMLGSK